MLLILCMRLIKKGDALDDNRVVVLGAGGHCKSVLETVDAQGLYTVHGLTDARADRSLTHVLGRPILGDDSMLSALKSVGLNKFIVGMGAVGNNLPRAFLYELGIDNAMIGVCAIHPTAHISASASILAGTVVFAGAIIGPDAVIGHNVIVNHGAIIDHDCKIGDHAHIATGACLAGNVRVSNFAHIGSGATLIQGITVGEYSIVGAGSVVVKDVHAGTTVFGVPATKS